MIQKNLSVDDSDRTLILLSKSSINECLSSSRIELHGSEYRIDHLWSEWKVEFQNRVGYLNRHPWCQEFHFWLILDPSKKIEGVAICTPESEHEFLRENSGGVMNIEYFFISKFRPSGLGRSVVNRLSRYISDSGEESTCLLSIGFERFNSDT